jgi:uncharacterized protein (DUF111 family)
MKQLADSLGVRVMKDQTNRLERRLAEARLRLDAAWAEIHAAQAEYIDARVDVLEHDRRSNERTN